MIPILTKIVASQYWKFDPKEIQSKISKSMKKPLFIIGYSPYCGHCTTIPNETAIFRNLTDRRKDFYFTSINCAEGTDCYYFHVPHTPYKALVYGEDRNYWPVTKAHNATEWVEFIDNTLKPKAIEVQSSSEEELAPFKKAINKGGSMFYLEVPNAHHRFLREYRDAAMRYFIYHSSFAYRIVPGSKPKLTIWTSNECSITFDKLNGLTNIIKKYKFGAMHKYSMQEWIEAKKTHNVSLLLVEDSPVRDKGEIVHAQKNIVKSMADQYCGVLQTGYMVGKYGDDVMKQLNLSYSDLPMILFAHKSCVSSYKGRTTDLLQTDFMNMSLNYQLCDKTYDNRRGQEKITDSYHDHITTRVLWWRRKVKGWMFSLIYIVLMYALLMYLPLRRPDRPKRKRM